jgi:TonB-dependent SusC/RagA subfamily outer membrane receptor
MQQRIDSLMLRELRFKGDPAHVISNDLMTLKSTVGDGACVVGGYYRSSPGQSSSTRAINRDFTPTRMRQAMASRLMVLALLMASTSNMMAGQSESSILATRVTVEATSQVAAVPLDRVISLDIRSEPMEAALEKISVAAHTEITFGVRDQTAMLRRVSLQAMSITVRDALVHVLAGTGLSAETSALGDIVLVHSSGNRNHLNVSDSTSTIKGQVVDRHTGAPIFGAVVQVDGLNARTSTSADGRFSLVLRAGTWNVHVRQIGYTRAERVVQALVGQTTNADFSLELSPKLLDQVVTTVTGPEQLDRSGASIATINADSVVSASPVTDLAEIINARAAGVQVFSVGGLSGTSPEIDIRGQNSGFMSNQPIMYVDGVRVDNSVSTRVGNGTEGTSAGRFNDISPDEIASIQIVRGASAATLYGTDASNGVILITTKRGTAGRQQWTAYTEQGMIAGIPGSFITSYAPWGHAIGSTQDVPGCTLILIGQHQCQEDSVSQFSPFRNSQTTPLGLGNRQAYGLQVNGGSTAMHYFASGGYEGEVGFLRMPFADQRFFAPAQGAAGLSEADLHPNAVEKYSGRVNLMTTLGRSADLSVSTSYLSKTSRIPDTQDLEFGEFGPGYLDTASGGWYAGLRPGYFFLDHADEATSHFTGGATVNWHPADWLAGHATTGIDFSDDQLGVLSPPNNITSPTGDRTNTQTNQHLYTVDLGLRSTLQLLPGFTSTTAVGGQLVRTQTGVTTATATNLAPGCATVLCTLGTPLGMEQTLETSVAGGYVEQTFTIRESLSLVGGIRADGAGAFGQSYKTVLYPKVSGSWSVTDERAFAWLAPMGKVHLRAAYGEAGVQPAPTAALTIETPLPGVPPLGTTSQISQYGNPNLRPETQRELETGVDYSSRDDRVSLQFTYYNKQSSHALVNLTTPTAYGALPEVENLGEVRNRGAEVAASVRLLETRFAKWDVSVNGSLNHNKVLSLPPGFGLQFEGNAQNAGIKVGAPLFSYFARPYTYVDANHDGIIEPSEITVDTAYRYVGPSDPTRQFTASTGISLFSQHVRISAQLDYRGGFTLFDVPLAGQCAVATCPWASYRSTSLAHQAAVAAADPSLPAPSYGGFMEDGSFWRLREIAATFQMPTLLVRSLRSRDLSVTLSIRNAALWTAYRGGDPESKATAGLAAEGAYSFGTPVARYWLARVNVGI